MGGEIMNIFKVNKVMDRLNQMIDNAIEGRAIENGFDETKMSALETKLANYLAANRATKSQLLAEKKRIHQLISDISHQTKTPITNILLYSQLLEESNFSEKERECVKLLTQQAEKLNFLIVSLVKTSRFETGIIAVHPKKESVQNLFDNIKAQATQSAKAKNIKLEIDETHISANFDLKWTTEAIYNIVDNAIKYTPASGTVTIKAISYEIFTRIDVVDTGIGISEDDTAKIFTRFYRSPQVSDIEGVGIGLYFAREIISNQGGYIKVSSKEGRGSTFSVFLPKE